MRRRYLFFAVAFLLLAIAGGLLWPQKEKTGVITLPDGKTVEFLSTTIGLQTFTTEKPWHKTARRILPNALQTWIPQAVSGSCSSGTNSITVFFQVTDPSGAPIVGTPWQSYRAEDDTGFLSNPGGGYCSFGGGVSTRIYGLSLTAHPRRDPSFRFHFIGAEDSSIGTLRIPNPVSGPFPNWTPLPLPQTATNGPVILTLKGLQHYDSKRWQSVGLKWKTDSTAPHWKRAKLRSSTLLDATGNDAQWLSPREPAWKLRTTFHREHDDDFLPDERWRLSEIPIPGKGRFLAMDQATNIMGVTIVAQTISSPGRFYVTNGIHHALDASKPDDSGFSSSTSGNIREDSFGSSKPFLMVEARNQQDGDDIRINVFDDQGSKLTDHPNGTLIQSRSSSVSLFLVRFDIPPEAKSLSVETIVSRPLVFEFMVNPQDVQPAKRPLKR